MARPTVVEMNLLIELDGFGVVEVLIVIRGGHVEDLAGIAQTDRGEGLDGLRFEGHEDLFDVGEDASFTLGSNLGLREVVEAKDEILGRDRDRLTGCGREDVVRREHQDRGFNLGFGRERDVHGHLIAVEIGVEGGADERMDLDRLAFDEHRLKRLNTKAMEGRGAVQQGPGDP